MFVSSKIVGISFWSFFVVDVCFHGITLKKLVLWNESVCLSVLLERPLFKLTLFQTHFLSPLFESTFKGYLSRLTRLELLFEFHLQGILFKPFFRYSLLKTTFYVHHLSFFFEIRFLSTVFTLEVRFLKALLSIFTFRIFFRRLSFEIYS